MSTRRNCAVTLLFLGLVLSCGLAAAQQTPALTPKNPIRLTNVEGRMDHLSIDVKGQRLFVTAFDNHTLEVIDLKTGRQVHTIPDLNEPQAPFYDPATNRLFVASGGDGTLKIFDGTTYRLLQNVPLGEDADNVRYDARSRHIIIGYGGEKFLAGKVARQGGDGALAVLDTNGKKITEIPLDAHPESFQLEKIGTRVFVNVPDHQEVEVADLAKGTVLARWPDKQSGVVDSNCRSFDHKNLFVAGSSVFATGAPTNPTITIAALALRTAKAIERQLASVSKTAT